MCYVVNSICHAILKKTTCEPKVIIQNLHGYHAKDNFEMFADNVYMHQWALLKLLFNSTNER